MAAMTSNASHRCYMFFGSPAYPFKFPQSMGSVAPARKSVFYLVRLNLIRQSCVVLRETFVQLRKSFRGGATTPESIVIKFISIIQRLYQIVFLEPNRMFFCEQYCNIAMQCCNIDVQVARSTLVKLYSSF